MKLWLIPVMSKTDKAGVPQRLPKRSYILASGAFSFQALTASDAAGYVANGQVREAEEADRAGALAVLDGPPLGPT